MLFFRLISPNDDLTISVHSALISGPIDSIFSQIVERGGYALRSAPSLNREYSDFFVQTAASCLSEQLRQWKKTWLQRSPTLLSIGPPASPKANLWKLTERLFSTHFWRRAPKQWPTWPVERKTVNVRSEVIPLGVKLKVAVLSMRSWKFVYTACVVREVIAYECTHVWASEKSGICKTGSVLKGLMNSA
jgi:hypothetical protein